MGTKKIAVGGLPEDSVRLEFVSGTSDKFWQLTKLRNEMYLAEWGRNGSPPQGQKEYTEHEARKKLAEKIGKGYQQIGPARGTEQRLAAKRVAEKREKKQEEKRNTFNFMEELRRLKT